MSRAVTHGRRRLATPLRRGLHAAVVGALLLALAGCVPIGVRVQNMLAGVLG